jgi:hypothetical protein
MSIPVAQHQSARTFSFSFSFSFSSSAFCFFPLPLRTGATRGCAFARVLRV